MCPKFAGQMLANPGVDKLAADLCIIYDMYLKPFIANLQRYCTGPSVSAAVEDLETDQAYVV